MVEHSAENAGVVSSILTLGTTISIPLTWQPSGSSSVVEHFLAKEGVGGSNPLSRSSDSSKTSGCRVTLACAASYRRPVLTPPDPGCRWSDDVRFRDNRNALPRVWLHYRLGVTVM